MTENPGGGGFVMAKARLTTVRRTISLLIALSFSILSTQAKCSSGSGTAEINLDAHLPGWKVFCGTGISTNDVCRILEGKDHSRLWSESITEARRVLIPSMCGQTFAEELRKE
jgi:hypothetical protein